ncbi:lipocalin-like domain-containing protein [Hymenobacter terricola]|uniref:lipocalin family protein n=1 Tax=Hymenobacter terricola TaxID=2819236 RepID=UPI001B307FA1|nr:lipocalin family protein [Hymenobacter terricola]
MKRRFSFALLCMALAGCATKAADDPQPAAGPPSLVGTWALTDDVSVTTYNDGRPPRTQTLTVTAGDAESTFTAAGGLNTVLSGAAQTPSTYVYAGSKLTVTYPFPAGAYSEFTVSTLTADRLVYYSGTLNAVGTTRTLSFKRR